MIHVHVCVHVHHAVITGRTIVVCWCRRLQYIWQKSTHSPSQKIRHLSVTRSHVTANKVWIPGAQSKEQETAKKDKKKKGVELKTKQGNKQWISDDVFLENLQRKHKTESNIKAGGDRQRSKSRSGRRRSGRVSIEGRKFMLSRGGKSLKHIATPKGAMPKGMDVVHKVEPAYVVTSIIIICDLGHFSGHKLKSHSKWPL